MLERTALNLVEADRIDQIFGAQNPEELPHVEFRHQNLLVALEDIAHIGGKRIEMAKVEMPDLAALVALPVDGLGDSAERGAPGDDQQVAF